MTTAIMNQKANPKKQGRFDYLLEYLSKKPNISAEYSTRDNSIIKIVYAPKVAIYFNNAKDGDGIQLKAGISEYTAESEAEISSFVSRSYQSSDYSPISVRTETFHPLSLDLKTNRLVPTETRRICLEAVVSNESETDRFYEVLSGICSNLYLQKHS